MERRGDHAVVVGASMGGLLAARVLSEHYEQVTVVERDACPGTAEARKGVPQARHAHGLLVKGVEAIEALEPGIVAALERSGGLRGDMSGDGIWCHGGHRHASFTSGLQGLLVSRLRLEAEVLARVRSRPNVRLRERTDALGLAFAAGGARVAGLRTRARGDGAVEEVLGADLVVDASGRGTRAPAWLAQAGYPPPPVEQVAVDVRYATRVYRRRPTDLGGLKFAVVSAAPGVPRTAAALAMEGDRWIVSACGYGEDPPGDPEGFAAFLGSLAVPDLAALVRGAEPVGDAVRHRVPVSLRRRYERLRRRPEGLLALGDALCGFNPVYGQGITVAALEALALRDLLREGRPTLTRRFFRRASRLVDVAWATTTASDLGLGVVPGRRTAAVRLGSWYLSKLHAAAQTDPAVAAAFLAVVDLDRRPGSILRPEILYRVLRAHAGGRARAARGDRGLVARPDGCSG